MKLLKLILLLIMPLFSNTCTWAQSSEITSLFKNLTKSAEWRLVATINIKFRTYHPQGMVIIDDVIYFSSVKIIESPVRYEKIIDGYDRTAGTGEAFIFKVDVNGNPIDSVKVGEGNIYHPGGIDYDGEFIWIPVAEYRPNSRSIIYKIDPANLNAMEIFRFDDHIGGIVYNPSNQILYGINWGSRLFYSWKFPVTEPHHPSIKQNPNHYIDYQDCHLVDENCFMCSGLNLYQIPILGEFAFGGLDLIDLQRLTAIHQIPVLKWIKANLAMTTNPFYVQLVENRLRFYFMPEDDESRIYVFDAVN